jgi:hypothetical protein
MRMNLSKMFIKYRDHYFPLWPRGVLFISGYFSEGLSTRWSGKSWPLSKATCLALPGERKIAILAHESNNDW